MSSKNKKAETGTLKRHSKAILANDALKEEPDALREDLVAYALKFEGNPYVYGGTSLTNGADCSGFVQSVYKDKGIKIPRNSRAQAAGGKKIPVDEVKPADLIFYKKNGIINHVALYIGDHKVITASSPSLGIRIADYDYRKPCKAVSYIN